MRKHLKEQNMSYWQHWLQAMTYFATIQKAALCVLIHAFIPDVFCDTASKIIKKLAHHFEQKCSKQ
jgi:hypothetical protein